MLILNNEDVSKVLDMPRCLKALGSNLGVCTSVQRHL